MARVLLSVQGLLPRIALGVFLPSSITILLSLLPMHTALVTCSLNTHVRRNRFTIPIFFQPRPYRLKLLFPRSDRSFALLTDERIDSFLLSSTCTQEETYNVDKTKFSVFKKFYTRPWILDTSKLCEAREKMNI